MDRGFRKIPGPGQGAGEPLRYAPTRLAFQQFCIPIRDVDGIEKWHPFLVAGHAKGFLHEWRPLRLERLAYERHAGLVRGPAAFAMIALVARAHDIFPNRRPALGARHDVVEIKLLARQALAAVLAGAFVAGVNVIAAKTYLALGHAIVGDQ